MTFLKSQTVCASQNTIWL